MDILLTLMGRIISSPYWWAAGLCGYGLLQYAKGNFAGRPTGVLMAGLLVAMVALAGN